MDPFFGIAIGVGLSAAAGFRAFLPLLMTSLAARAGWISLSPGMEWVGTDLALIALATATGIEILAYYVPWLDNALDTIATPVAVTAGVLATAAVTPGLPPLLRWVLAVIAGSAAAGVIQASTVLLRLKSSAFTGGLANPLVATGELVGSLVMSLLALMAPLVALVIVAGLLVWIVRRGGRIVRARRERTVPRVQSPG